MPEKLTEKEIRDSETLSQKQKTQLISYYISSGEEKNTQKLC
jgi:hypothetical protein